ncbi:MAG: GGDEF domain-containing protein [Candidatus Omnitrophica bacterium]|nr:GGDEF domain-containing protein [Candidatus Omnitrophota bacterium]
MDISAKIPEWGKFLLKLAVALLALAFISGVATADFATKYETAVSLLYLVAIVGAAWFSWRYAAFLIALLSGISDVVITYIINNASTAINILNAGIQSVFFLVFVFVLLALKDSQERLKKMARTDPLTDVVNSKYFLDIGNTEIQRSLRYKHPLSVAYMDVDNFKAVNDTLGHSAGNALLREISEKIRNAIRKTDTVARLGGDEFAVLFPETDRDSVRAAVGRIQKSLADTKAPEVGPITFSIGVVTDDGKSCAFDEMIKAADSLMYAAKHGGKNTIREGAFGECASAKQA